MTTVIVPRVHFFEKQFLRVGEFKDEQTYHIAARRRHNITEHLWGIVRGLEIAQDEDLALIVRPGMAIDGYGRELLLAEKKSLDAKAFDTLGTDQLDAWLVYDRRDGETAPEGYSGCDSDSSRNAYRSEETPLVLLERPISRSVDARRPPGVSKDVFDANVPLVSDDPKDTWRVYLGRIKRLAQDQFQIDLSERTYAGLVGEVIDHPANAARMEIGKEPSVTDRREFGGLTYTYTKNIEGEPTQSRRFAVFIPEDVDSINDTGEIVLWPRLEILQDGILRLRGSTVINGNLRIIGGAVQFSTPAQFENEPVTADNTPLAPAIYRIIDEGKDQLRIDLGANNTLNREFVIGFSNESGEFTTCLKLELKEEEGAPKPRVKVTINGDLMLNGDLIGTDLVPRTLNEEVINAIKASFQAGVAAGNNA